jgi:hypothetical protein
LPPGLPQNEVFDGKSAFAKATADKTEECTGLAPKGSPGENRKRELFFKSIEGYQYLKEKGII